MRTRNFWCRFNGYFYYVFCILGTFIQNNYSVRACWIYSLTGNRFRDPYCKLQTEIFPLWLMYNSSASANWRGPIVNYSPPTE